MQIYDIACFGTSLTAGSGNDGVGGLTYGSYCPALQRALGPGKQSHVRVHNFGSGGFTSSVGISTYLALVAALRPKAVLIEFATNDCLGAGSGGLSTADCTTNHNTIINALKALPTPPAIYLMVMNPMVGAGTSATARSNLGTYNSLYASIATAQSVGLINNTTAYGALTLTDVPDGVHPTLACNLAKLVPNIATTLSPLIT